GGLGSSRGLRPAELHGHFRRHDGDRSHQLAFRAVPVILVPAVGPAFLLPDLVGAFPDLVVPAVSHLRAPERVLRSRDRHCGPASDSIPRSSPPSRSSSPASGTPTQAGLLASS